MFDAAGGGSSGECIIVDEDGDGSSVDGGTVDFGEVDTHYVCT